MHLDYFAVKVDRIKCCCVFEQDPRVDWFAAHFTIEWQAHLDTVQNAAQDFRQVMTEHLRFFNEQETLLAEACSFKCVLMKPIGSVLEKVNNQRV